MIYVFLILFVFSIK